MIYGKINKLEKVNEMNKQEDYERKDNKSGKETIKTVKLNKGIIAALGLLALLMVVYFGGAVYFSNRFFFNTQVNNIGFSGQKTADVREFIERKADDFNMTIIGDDESLEKIYASDVNLTFRASEEIEELLETQNPFLWPLSLLNSQEINAQLDISFDEELFNERVKNLEVVTKGQTSPVSASVVIEGTDVTIVPHEYGNVVNVEHLQVELQKNISTLADEFNALEADIFVQPEFKTDSPEIVEAYETVSQYLSTEITYLVGTEVLVDKTLISDWVTIDDELNVHLDEEQVNQWLYEFSSTVNTGNHVLENSTKREFRSHDGRDITVTGGYFGWMIHHDEEFAELIENIHNGDVIEREPIYSQRGVTHGENDWGDTFLQVDLSQQHMWAIIDGKVVFDSPVVTGNPNNDRNTPQGVYSILEKLNPTVLISPWLDDKGKPTYEIPVDYWMRTTWSGYGFHDMPQPRYGGTQYLRSGSSGCTNMPLDKARELFGLTYIGMPVVVHY